MFLQHPSLLGRSKCASLHTNASISQTVSLKRSYHEAQKQDVRQKSG